jgi:molecular chaperone GrpE
MQDRSPVDYLLISQSQQQETIDRVGLLLKEKLSLQQSLINQLAENTANNEQLYLELLEIFDALESLIDYFKNNPQLTERTIARLPKSLSTIQSKLLSTLAKQQVELINTIDTYPDWSLYQIIDTQIDPSLTAPVVRKVVRQGFKKETKILRPVEVIVDKPLV